MRKLSMSELSGRKLCAKCGQSTLSLAVASVPYKTSNHTALFTVWQIEATPLIRLTHVAPTCSSCRGEIKEWLNEKLMQLCRDLWLMVHPGATQIVAKPEEWSYTHKEHTGHTMIRNFWRVTDIAVKGGDLYLETSLCDRIKAE